MIFLENNVDFFKKIMYIIQFSKINVLINRNLIFLEILN